MRLGMKSRQEIIEANCEEYRRAGKKGRGELLDRLAPVTGLNRDYLATALSRYGKAGKDGNSVLRTGAADGRSSTGLSSQAC